MMAGQCSVAVLGVLVLATLAATGAAQRCLPSTAECGTASTFDTTMWLESIECGYNYNCRNTTTDREKGEQRVLQLFHPPVLPFRLTQLCGMITERDNRYTGIKAPDFFNVTFYVYSADPTVDTRYNLPRPGTELAHSSLCQINKTSPRWWYPTIDWNLKIWNETIFVGVGWNQCDQGCIWRNYPRPGSLANNTPWYLWSARTGVFELNEDIGSLGAAGLRVVGSAYSYLDGEPAAAGWTCDEAKYGDGTTCDCGCGLPDPDCDTPARRAAATGCGSARAVCVEGRCVEPGWDGAACGLEEYGDGARCSCGCGGSGTGTGGGALADPDCFNPGLARGCPQGLGVCNAEEGYRCDRGWTCNASEYGDGVCTCGRDCGIADPDCADAAKPTTCDAGDTMVCVDNECRYPRRYTCPGLTYRDGRTCNCNCTVADPDCASVFHSVVGCPDDGRLYSCDTRAGGSTCVPAYCGNGFVDRIDNEECDGGTGCTDCRCVRQKGYRAKSPPDVDCEPICGDGLVRDPEECEPGHAFCDNATCRCLPGHEYSPELLRCTGCGNHRVEPARGEQCDGGAGCDPATCRCARGYAPLDPLAPACRRRPVPAAAIAVPVVAVAVAATGAVLLVLYCRRWRRIAPPQPDTGSGVVLMEVGEDGALKVAPQPGALSATATGTTGGAAGAGAAAGGAGTASVPGQIVPPGTVSTVPPGTLAGDIETSLASVAATGTTTTTTGAGAAGAAGAAAPPPPAYTASADPSLCATQAFSGTAGDDPALAQTMFVAPRR